MSEPRIDLNEMAQFTQLTPQVRAELRKAWQLLQPRMPAIMRAYTSHLRRFPCQAAPQLRERPVENWEGANLQHWHLCFLQGFDETFLGRCERIAAAHVRARLSPKWMVGGHLLVLQEMTAVLRRHFLWPWQSLERVSMEDAVTRLVMAELAVVCCLYAHLLRQESLDLVLNGQLPEAPQAAA
jgi:hypothetical protein